MVWFCKHRMYRFIEVFCAYGDNLSRKTVSFYPGSGQKKALGATRAGADGHPKGPLQMASALSVHHTHPLCNTPTVSTDRYSWELSPMLRWSPGCESKPSGSTSAPSAPGSICANGIAFDAWLLLRVRLPPGTQPRGPGVRDESGATILCR